MEAGVPGEVVVKPVVEELEREVVLTQHHLTIQKELNVMDRLVIDVTLTIVLVSTIIYIMLLFTITILPEHCSIPK